MSETKQHIIWGMVNGMTCALLWDKTTGNMTWRDLQEGEAIPDHLTSSPPTVHPSGSFLRDVWDEAMSGWKKVPDYSSTTIYNRETGEPAPRLRVGQPLPDEMTTEPPAAHD